MLLPNPRGVRDLLLFSSVQFHPSPLPLGNDSRSLGEGASSRLQIGLFETVFCRHSSLVQHRLEQGVVE